MLTSTPLRTDADMHRHVLAELEFDPTIDAGQIGVAAENGVITLTGTVGSFAERWAAEKAVKRVRGVRALANDIAVELPGTHQTNDTDIAASAASIIAWDPSIPKSIQVDVSGGHVTLTGTVDWQFQRERMEKHIRHIGGVTGISNGIALRGFALPADVKARIQDALKRDAEIEAGKIEVTIDRGDVTLRGTAHSWTELSAAGRAAWSVPGVQFVHNKIEITP